MIMKVLTKSMIAAAVLFLAIGQAQAATYNLSLTDIPGTYSSGSSTTDNTWSVSLDGLGAGFTAYQGDTVNATITLNSVYTTAIGANDSWLDLGLYGNNSSGYDTSTTATTTFYHNGAQVASYTGTIITSEIGCPPALYYIRRIVNPPSHLTRLRSTTPSGRLAVVVVIH